MAVPEMDHIVSIADVIRLAVAPVFLLSGIAAMLNVLTNRLTRIVDRAGISRRSFPPPPPAASRPCAPAWGGWRGARGW